MKCRCHSCLFIAKVARMMRPMSKRDAAVIEKLLLKWEAASTDASYYRAKLDRKWPDEFGRP